MIHPDASSPSCDWGFSSQWFVPKWLRRCEREGCLRSGDKDQRTRTVTPNQPSDLDPGTPGTLSGLVASPFGLAFDASGDLFITSCNSISSNQIIVLPSASATSILGQSVTPQVPVVLDPGSAGTLSGLLDGPSGLAFDRAGDLFVANDNSSTVTVIPSQSVPGAPTEVSVKPCDGELEVSWNEPVDTGGLLITG